MNIISEGDITISPDTSQTFIIGSVSIASYIDATYINMTGDLSISGTIYTSNIQGIETNIEDPETAENRSSYILNIGTQDGPNIINIGQYGDIVNIAGTQTIINAKEVNLSVSGNIVGSSISISGNANINGSASISGSVFANYLSVNGSNVIFNGLLNNHFSVSGTSYMSNRLSINGTSYFTDQLSVSGITTLANHVSISGNTTIRGNISISGTTTIGNWISISGISYLRNQLSVAGLATLDNTLSVSGNIIVLSNLSVSGNIHLGRNISVQGITYLTDQLSVSQNIICRSNVSVSGNINIGGNSSVSGTTTIGSWMSISGISYFRNQISVAGTTTLASTLNVGGSTALASTASVAGNLNIGGTTTLNNTVTIVGISYMSNQVSTAGETTINNQLTVTGSTLIQNNVSVNGISYFANQTSINGNSTINGSTSVSGTVFARNLSINVLFSGILNNNLSVSGLGFFGNQLSVSGVSYFRNQLSINGNAFLNASASVWGTVFANQLSVNLLVSNTLNNHLSVSGLAVIGNQVSISGISYLANQLSINGNTTVNSSVSISGTIFANNLSVNVISRAIINSNISVAGSATLSSHASVNGIIYANDIQRNGSSTVMNIDTTGQQSTINIGKPGDTVNIAGDKTIVNATEVNLSVSGPIYGLLISINGDAIVNGSMSVSGRVFANYLSVVDSNIEFNGVLNNNLTVSEMSYFSNNISVNGNANVNGNTSISGIIFGNNLIVASSSISSLTIPSSENMRFNYMNPSSSSGITINDFNADLSLATPLISIKNNGRVGFGLDNPQEILDINGNIKLSGFIYGRRGQVLQTMVYTSETTGITINNAAVGGGQNWTKWATITFTPYSNNSTITVHADASYQIAGWGPDAFYSGVWYNDNNVSPNDPGKNIKFQRFDNASTYNWPGYAGGGTRSSTIFPIMCTFNNSQTSVSTIEIKINTQSGDDTVWIGGFTTNAAQNTSYCVIVTEIQR